MIAELTVQHAYIEGGDFELPPRPRVGAARAPASSSTRRAGRYRIAQDLRAARTRRSVYRSPLTEVGVDAKVGDYVLAIDGEELTPTDDPYRLLRNKADRPVS